MSCRNLIRAHKPIEDNAYGYAVATVNVRDEGQGFKCAFVRCWECDSNFVAVWPQGMKVVPCAFCENQNVRVR
jgi:hypothetical protein